MNERVTRRLRIHGRVQGVWYRESMRQEAERLEITGWVRNRMDGTVEALVQGPAQAVRDITDWARRGPPRAEVARVEIVEEDSGVFGAFDKLPKA